VVVTDSRNPSWNSEEEFVELLLDYLMTRPIFWDASPDGPPEGFIMATIDVKKAWFCFKISKELLARAATHLDTSIRLSIASRSDLPEDIVALLLNVKSQSEADGYVIEELLRYQFSEPVLLAIMRHAPSRMRDIKWFARVLSVLSYSKTPAVRLEIARCEDLYRNGSDENFLQVITHLAVDSDTAVKSAVRASIEKAELQLKA
jgi:hypothetical protein